MVDGDRGVNGNGFAIVHRGIGQRDGHLGRNQRGVDHQRGNGGGSVIDIAAVDHRHRLVSDGKGQSVEGDRGVSRNQGHLAQQAAEARDKSHGAGRRGAFLEQTDGGDTALDGSGLAGIGRRLIDPSLPGLDAGLVDGLGGRNALGQIVDVSAVADDEGVIARG